MSVDIVAQFAHKQTSERWLTDAWFAWSERQIELKAQFASLKSDKHRIRDFENRCVQALGRSNPATESDDASFINREIRTIVERVAGNSPSMVSYTNARRSYSAKHAATWMRYEKQLIEHRKLKKLTKRYEKRFGFGSEPSALADHFDRTRDEERWSFVDAFFHEREMPGHNRYVCPVCAPVAKNGTVADYAITSTGYVDARCRNFDCPRYGERLMTLDRFTDWLRHQTLEANGIARDRYEYDAEFGWQAREDAKLAEQAKVAELREMSPRMQDVRQRALQKTGLWARNRTLLRTSYAEGCSYSRRQASLAMPVRGTEAAGSCEWVEETNPYLNRKRPYTHLKAKYLHKQPTRWERDYGFESPECWDYTLNPNAIGVQSSGSLVMESR